jgi:hypothetical protein
MFQYRLRSIKCRQKTYAVNVGVSNLGVCRRANVKLASRRAADRGHYGRLRSWCSQNVFGSNALAGMAEHGRCPAVAGQGRHVTHRQSSSSRGTMRLGSYANGGREATGSATLPGGAFDVASVAKVELPVMGSQTPSHRNAGVVQW